MKIQPLLFVYAVFIAFSLLLSPMSISAEVGQQPDGVAVPLHQSNPVLGQPMAVSFKDKIIIVPVHGVIIPDSATIRFMLGGEQSVVDQSILDVIEKAETDGALQLILDIDSPGGVVDSCEQICTRLIACKIPTTALVTNKAISGGSMVATACRRIVMIRGTTIGDCEPHAINQQLPDYMREKVESPIRARMRENAQTNGYPGPLLEAMVTKSIELFRVTYADGKSEFLHKQELELQEKQIQDKSNTRRIVNKRLVVQEGSLLTLTTAESMEYGLAESVVSSREVFFADQGISDDQMITIESRKDSSEGDGVFAISTRLSLLLLLCFIIGVAGVVVEAHVPGFGVPGVIGIIGFSCFFTLLFMQGRATPLEMGFFLLGISLLLVELFILPGFGIAGIAGITSILASLILGYLPDFESEFWKLRGTEELDSMIYFFAVAFSSGFLVVVLLLRYLTKIPLLSHFILSRNLRSGREVMAEESRNSAGTEGHRQEILPSAADLVGVEGMAMTTLRPSGKMRADDGRVIDVVSAGALIAEGHRIKVTGVNGPRVAVSEVSGNNA